ncbi:hypothetical protein LX32DRAFT_249294 [Colletotrichum zoysiae]|uniref:Uncharacterized protein n=1 Tax=Colletotrichum zoysiae TaxID=1216348 RepID=A0AAD9H471_9PEZI|nr:hypothetical protein LX32DRAFT_249294 [Colletotrichum zoysiae]
MLMNSVPGSPACRAPMPSRDSPNPARLTSGVIRSTIAVGSPIYAYHVSHVMTTLHPDPVYSQSRRRVLTALNAVIPLPAATSRLPRDYLGAFRLSLQAGSHGGCYADSLLQVDNRAKRPPIRCKPIGVCSSVTCHGIRLVSERSVSPFLHPFSASVPRASQSFAALHIRRAEINIGPNLGI